MVTRKSFKNDINDPVLNFISIPEEALPVEEKTGEGEFKSGFQEHMRSYEAKSKRIQVLMRPSLYEKLKKISLKEDVSVNSMINHLLEKGVEESF